MLSSSLLELEFIRNALKEDIGRGDLFYNLAPQKKVVANIIAKEDGILSGIAYVSEFKNIINCEIEFFKSDGDELNRGDLIAKIIGEFRDLLLIERTFLNTLQHSSGIATNVRKFVNKISDLNVKLLDTRKTRPYLRVFEKYSSRVGGAINHRMGLDDSLMLKDTHLKHIKNLKEFIQNARKSIPFTTKIEVEAGSVEFAKEVMSYEVDIVMCDNMSVSECSEVVNFRDENYPQTILEASGNINLENIRNYAKSGVNFISSGSLIHQATWLDFSMKME